MIRWEYLIDGFSRWTEPQLLDVLNKRGADGWEFVAIDWDNRQVIFKRPSGEVR